MADPGPRPSISSSKHIFVDVTPFEYPHETHDISTVSHYFLEVTAFAPGDSLSVALHMRKTMNSKTAEECYTDISAKSKATNTLDFGDTKHAIRDPDRVGILLEHNDMYYTVMDNPFTDGTRDQDCGWLEANQIDMHVLCEWASLPKKIIGTDFIAAATFPDGEGGGWWHVYGEMITSLRAALEGEAESMPIWSGGSKLAGRPEKDIMASMCGTLFRRQVLLDQARWTNWREMESILNEFRMWNEMESGRKEFTEWDDMGSVMKEFTVWDGE